MCTAKAVVRGKLIGLHVYIRKKRLKIYVLNIHLKKSAKESQVMFKESQRGEIINMRAEIQ